VHVRGIYLPVDVVKGVLKVPLKIIPVEGVD